MKSLREVMEILAAHKEELAIKRLVGNSTMKVKERDEKRREEKRREENHRKKQRW